MCWSTQRYTVAIGDSFLSMYDNAKTHRAQLVKIMLEMETSGVGCIFSWQIWSSIYETYLDDTSQQDQCPSTFVDYLGLGIALLVKWKISLKSYRQPHRIHEKHIVTLLAVRGDNILYYKNSIPSPLKLKLRVKVLC